MKVLVYNEKGNTEEVSLDQLTTIELMNTSALLLIGNGEEELSYPIISKLWNYVENGGALYGENISLLDFPSSRLFGFKQDFKPLRRTNEKLYLEANIAEELKGYLLEWEGTYQKGYCINSEPLVSIGVFKDTHKCTSLNEILLPAMTRQMLGKGLIVYSAIPLFSQITHLAYRPNWLWNKLILQLSDILKCSLPLIKKEINNSNRDIEAAIHATYNWFMNSGILPQLDGKEGVYENVHSVFREISKDRRPDCHAHTALMFYLYGKYTEKQHAIDCSMNVMTYLMKEGYQDTDPHSGSYGFWKWFQFPSQYPEDMFTDDNAWVTVTLLYLYKETGNQMFKDKGLLTAYALLRTQFDSGLRPENYKGSLLRKDKIEYEKTLRASMNPHFESIAHVAFLLAYQVTKDEAFLNVSKKGTDYLLDHLQDMKWMYSKTSAFTRFSLALTGLYACTKEEKYQEALTDVMEYLLTHQHPLGGIEEADNPDPERYGLEDTGVYIYNNEGIADLLYTNNFLLMNSWEAFKHTGNERYEWMYKQLKEFLLYTQIESPLSLYNGGWMRAYDLNNEEYYGNNGDTGWGPYCMESGWTNAIIGVGLLLEQLDSSLFD